MTTYLLFLSAFGLLGYQFLRRRGLRERLVLLSFFFLLTFALLLHSERGPMTVASELLEKIALMVTLAWLVVDLISEWIEKRKREKKAFFLLRNGRGPFSEIISACRLLTEAKHGALIAIERKNPLDSWLQSGISLDARIKRETIQSVFTPPGVLHDGGMIIRGDRIAACGVVFPLSQRRDLPTEFGTRHRAALGLSESTDALVIAISEETGRISLADQGSLFYDVKTEKLPEILEKALRNRLVRRTFRKEKLRGLAPVGGLAKCNFR